MMSHIVGIRSISSFHSCKIWGQRSYESFDVIGLSEPGIGECLRLLMASRRWLAHWDRVTANLPFHWLKLTEMQSAIFKTHFLSTFNLFTKYIHQWSAVAFFIMKDKRRQGCSNNRLEQLRKARSHKHGEVSANTARSDEVVDTIAGEVDDTDSHSDVHTLAQTQPLSPQPSGVTETHLWPVLRVLNYWKAHLCRQRKWATKVNSGHFRTLGRSTNASLIYCVLSVWLTVSQSPLLATWAFPVNFLWLFSLWLFKNCT